jgi:Ca2+/Na+ antiporter
MFVRVMALTAGLAGFALPTLAASAIPGMLVSLIAAAWLRRRAGKLIASSAPVTVRNPFDLSPALLMMAMVMAFTLAARWVLVRYGDRGLAVVLAITGTIDVDSAIITMGSLPGGTLTPRTAGLVLLLATAAVVWLSEILVHQVEAVTEVLHLSEFFLGIILIPIIGNVAEHLVAVEVALKNQMDLSLEIALGSSLQIALFVAPVLVFVSLLFGQYLNLVFNQFELLALIGAVVISALVASDGETNWLEGAQLLAVYLILGVAFFFLPA